MRPLMHGDVSCAARALLNVPASARARLCRRLVHEAGEAYAHMQRTGKVHPLYGNGSLMSAARKRVLAAEPRFDDIEYCRCFEMVLRRLATVLGRAATA
ncbi:hypothetical protein [Pukyongiella litopenaei]|uniref:DUF7742 domain-containing protein n=1 Tax=Pukyongiella litopenaei TaxID=2605946 RepID=A0A2S0MRK6_9RHOB|nr:hypothetical protein [Pukyongiella litopenaei]AVO38518.1 hypothetical protein C6Y53_13005 [Pukyongiella litopenaei]